ncbi:hypothetical protein [Desulfomonile tiedjei]|uniref:Uncharacterized protein n=1 Tax=Desulfomonile tiedjei (strain ATCC 49306 / DSM 6799 / DCB-1) TaxID=706587 RepID=I4CDX5_DESTA|nr:hypothetical protein [Desulfomonile tiedjei]AFM27766.1 hypothetical protein Desti_5163 [Desulfomonile tiedjei DSM 6799]
MQRIRVGQPFHPGVTGYEEAIHYNYTTGGHTLILSTKNPDLSLIYDIRKGPATLALGLDEEVLFFFGRFGDQSWQKAHYNWWINPPIMRPDPMDDFHNLKDGVSLNVGLINASNGLVAALRSVKISGDFSRCLLGSVEQQIRHPFDPMHYLEVVEKSRGKYLDESSILNDSICLSVIDDSLRGNPVFSDSTCHSEFRLH